MGVKMELLFATFLLLAPQVSPPNTPAITALTLKTWCETPFEKDLGTTASFCVGYIRGVADGWTYTTPLLKETARSCIPAQATAEQLKLVFLKYAADNPEYLHEGAAGVVLAALEHAFCPESRRPKQ